MRCSYRNSVLPRGALLPRPEGQSGALCWALASQTPFYHCSPCGCRDWVGVPMIQRGVSLATGTLPEFLISSCIVPVFGFGKVEGQQWLTSVHWGVTADCRGSALSWYRYCWLLTSGSWQLHPRCHVLDNTLALPGKRLCSHVRSSFYAALGQHNLKIFIYQPHGGWSWAQAGRA